MCTISTPEKQYRFYSIPAPNFHDPSVADVVTYFLSGSVNSSVSWFSSVDGRWKQLVCGARLLWRLTFTSTNQTSRSKRSHAEWIFECCVFNDSVHLDNIIILKLVQYTAILSIKLLSFATCLPVCHNFGAIYSVVGFWLECLHVHVEVEGWFSRLDIRAIRLFWWGAQTEHK